MNEKQDTEQGPERIWIRQHYMAADVMNGGVFHVERPPDESVEYVRADLAQQPATNERCGECGHEKRWLANNGTCRYAYTSSTEPFFTTCNCKCVFPATEAPAVPEWSVEHPEREREYWSNLGKVATTGAGEGERHVHKRCGYHANVCCECKSIPPPKEEEARSPLCGAVVSIAVPGSYCTRLKDHTGGHSEGAYEKPAPPAQPAAEGEVECEHGTQRGIACTFCDDLDQPSTPTTGAGVREKPEYDLDPLEFWRDLAEALGHPRPQKADVPTLVSEVAELRAELSAARDEVTRLTGMVAALEHDFDEAVKQANDE